MGVQRIFSRFTIVLPVISIINILWLAKFTALKLKPVKVHRFMLHVLTNHDPMPHVTTLTATARRVSVLKRI